MPFNPQAPGGPVTTILDRVALTLDAAMAIQAVKPAGEGITLTYDARAGAMEVLGRALQDMIAAETNSTVKTRLTAVAAQLGLL